MAKIVLEDNVEIEETTTEEVVAPTEDVETEPEESEEETTEDVVITHPEEEIDSDFGVDDTEENSDEDEGVMLLPSGEEDATPVYTGETVQAAETGEGKKWDSYTTESGIADDDELMILDKSAKANKRTLFSSVWDYILGKLATAVVSKLTTTDKTVIGALNELNSKAFSKGFYETESIAENKSCTVNIEALCTDVAYYGAYLIIIVPDNNSKIWNYFGCLFKSSNFSLTEIQCSQMRVETGNQNSSVLTITNLNKENRSFKVGFIKIL